MLTISASLNKPFFFNQEKRYYDIRRLVYIVTISQRGQNIPAYHFN